MQEEILASKNGVIKNLGISSEEFDRYVKKFGIIPIDLGKKIKYRMSDIEKIKADLDERKKICSLPNLISVPRSDWKPIPREEYYNLQDIGNLLKISKQHASTLVKNFKLKIYRDNYNAYWYSKAEIDSIRNDFKKYIKRNKKWVL